MIIEVLFCLVSDENGGRGVLSMDSIKDPRESYFIIFVDTRDGRKKISENTRMSHVRNKQVRYAHVRVCFKKNALKALKSTSLTIPYTWLRLAEEHNRILVNFLLPLSLLLFVLHMKCLSPV
jgi:hypothetical protein